MFPDLPHHRLFHTGDEKEDEEAPVMFSASDSSLLRDSHYPKLAEKLNSKQPAAWIPKQLQTKTK